jgi:hypothetical protein
MFGLFQQHYCRSRHEAILLKRLIIALIIDLIPQVTLVSAECFSNPSINLLHRRHQVLLGRQRQSAPRRAATEL